MSIADEYIRGLKAAYHKVGGEKAWEHFISTVCGASDADKAVLKENYPDIPEGLLTLLSFVDGTYYRQYGEEEVSFYFLGSDVYDGACPYFLYSAEELIDDKEVDYEANFADLFYDFHEDDGAEKYGIFVDDRIRSDGSDALWLCFADCFNNGGTSKLFIDFTPSEKGKKGQIIRYLHDPDELRVIADSFEEYLKMLMDNDYKFIDEDAVEWI